MTGDVAVFFQVVGYWRGVFVCLGYVFVWWVGCLFACLTVGVAVAVFFSKVLVIGEVCLCVWGVCLLVCLFVCLQGGYRNVCNKCWCCFFQVVGY